MSQPQPPPHPQDSYEIYRQVTRGTLTGFIHSGVLVGIGVLLPPVVLGYLSSTGYGYWVLIVSLASYVNLFEMGLTTGLVKIWAEQRREAQFAQAVGALNTVFMLFVAAGLLAFGMALVVVWKWPNYLDVLPWFVIGAALSLWGE